MKRRSFVFTFCGASWAVFILAMVWPTLALIGRCAAEYALPEGGLSFTSRQLLLFWRSLWLSAAATSASLLISLPGVYVLGQVDRLARRPLIVSMLMVVLLSPPTVYAFAWERILPGGFDSYVRCIFVWSLWTWPIPALLIGAAWSRVGRCAYEAAILVASPPIAFARAVLPTLSAPIGLSAMVVFVLCFSDYTVPHACSIPVYSTELLGWATSSQRVVDTVWPSMLPIGATGLALLVLYLEWRRSASARSDSDVIESHYGPQRSSILLIVALLFVAWVLPVGALVVRLASPAIVVQALKVYGTDLAWSLGVAVASGCAVVGMGLGLAAAARLRTLGLVWAVMFGALPGALVGESLVAAYNHAVTSWIYDHWPIVALSYVSRFGWVGVLTALVVTQGCPQVLIDQARTDGATETSILGRIRIPMHWPALFCGVGVAAAMSVADVATSSLVRVPGFSPIAHILMEKFHRFEDGMLVSLSLLLVAGAIPPALLLILALRRHRAACVSRDR